MYRNRLIFFGHEHDLKITRIYKVIDHEDNPANLSNP